MHYIFLVHGMGNASGEWSKEARALIARHYKKSDYSFLNEAWPFESFFKFEELIYNDIFDKYLAEAKKQSDKLNQWTKLTSAAEPALLKVMERIVDVAKTAPNTKNFLVSHIADVALFLMTDLGELVKNTIALEIVDRLRANKYNAADDSWSVIAHSLGTRVMTEVLQVGFMGQPSLRSFDKAKVVMMVSNTSRLLQGVPPGNSIGNVYSNAVYPSASELGVCEHYINCTHQFDPFAFIREFSPPADFGDHHAFIDNVYHPVKLAMSDITSKNIHSLEHYLEHPAVHTTLFRYLISSTGKYGPTEKEMADAMQVYRLNTMGADITSTWREALAKLKEPSYENFVEIFQAWEKYGALLS